MRGSIGDVAVSDGADVTPDLPAELPQPRIVLGTRTSQLARTQTDAVAGALEAAWPGLEVEVAGITTTGDRVLDEPLSEIGGKGVFTRELEAALREGEIDAAVHSLKDLPTDLGEEFEVLGVPERAEARDVLLGRDGPVSLDALAEGAVVGTSSLRRAAQLRARRPDCRVEDLRGNVETRVEKMRGGGYDAVVLAAAGLSRLGMLEGDAVLLSPPEWLPAPAQGALGVEGRAGDEAVAALVARLEDEATRAAVRAERSFLATLQGGCLVPVGAWARDRAGRLRLETVVLSTDGEEVLRATGESSRASAASLGRRLAERLLAEGAGRILAEVREAHEDDAAADDDASARGDAGAGGRGGDEGGT